MHVTQHAGTRERKGNAKTHADQRTANEAKSGDNGPKVLNHMVDAAVGAVVCARVASVLQHHGIARGLVANVLVEVHVGANVAGHLSPPPTPARAHKHARRTHTHTTDPRP